MEEKAIVSGSKSNEKKEKKDLKMRFCHSAYEIVEMIGAIAVCIIICFSFVVRLNVVDGPSMENTLHTGEYLVVSDLFYTPRRGDIIVFQDMTVAEQYRKPLVKRVIAVEGQETNMDFENGIVYIDGVAIAEDYISEPTYNKLDFIGPKTVPDGCVFVLGDNRNSSRDSRAKSIGMVDERLILGKVYAVVYPIDAIRWVR